MFKKERPKPTKTTRSLIPRLVFNIMLAISGACLMFLGEKISRTLTLTLSFGFIVATILQLLDNIFHNPNSSLGEKLLITIAMGFVCCIFILQPSYYIGVIDSAVSLFAHPADFVFHLIGIIFLAGGSLKSYELIRAICREHDDKNAPDIVE